MALFAATSMLACANNETGGPPAGGSGGSPGTGGERASGAGGGVGGGVGGATTRPDAAIDAGTTTGTGGQIVTPPDGGSDRGPSDATDSRPVDSGARDSGAGDANQPPITIWLAGDSTVQDYAAGNTEGDNGTTLEGWGQELAPFFNTRVVVSNQAIGGRSVAFFMWAVQRDAAGNYLCVDDQGNPNYQLDASGNHVDTAQWARIKAGIKPGDFLLAQFGTNDETHTCPRFVSLADFETDFGIMADAVRARGATPIFVTPMSHRIFVGATINNTLLPYANAMKVEATLKNVEVEDLNLRSVEYFNMVGNTFLATNIFDTGITHFIKPGAIKMAELITGEIRAHKGLLAAYLK
jgi:hypothetical protein